MLQSIHDKSKGLVTYLIVGFLIIVFVMWGISYYLKGFSAPSMNAAEVNGSAISMADFNRAYQSARSQASGALGEGAVKALKSKVLNTLMTRLLLSSSAEKLGFSLSNETLSSWIMSDLTFQENGKFSPKRYELLLQQLGINSQMLEAQIRQGVMIAQVQEGIAQSTFLLPDEATSYAALTHQTRRASMVVLPIESFQTKVTPSEEQVNAYYQAHLADFYSPAQIKVAYLDLKTDAAYSPLLDQLANITFENPGSLSEASKQLNLPIQESVYFSQKGGSTSLTKNPKVLAAAFSKEVLLDGNNSDVIKISPNESVVLRVIDQQKAHPQSLDEVRSQIIKILTSDQAEVLAKKTMDKLLHATDLEVAAKNLAAEGIPGVRYISTEVYTQDPKDLKKLDLINPALREQLFQQNNQAVDDSNDTSAVVKGEHRREILGTSGNGANFVLLNIKPSLPVGFGEASGPLPSDIYETQIHFSGLWGLWEYAAYEDALIDHAKIKQHSI